MTPAEKPRATERKALLVRFEKKAKALNRLSALRYFRERMDQGEFEIAEILLSRAISRRELIEKEFKPHKIDYVIRFLKFGYKVIYEANSTSLGR